MSRELHGPGKPVESFEETTHNRRPPQFDCPRCGARTFVAGAFGVLGISNGILWTMQCPVDRSLYEFETSTSFLEEAMAAMEADDDDV